MFFHERLPEVWSDNSNFAFVVPDDPPKFIELEARLSH